MLIALAAYSYTTAYVPHPLTHDTCTPTIPVHPHIFTIPAHLSNYNTRKLNARYQHAHDSRKAYYIHNAHKKNLTFATHAKYARRFK